MLYNELSQKNRFQSVPIAALCLYNIQPEKKSLSIIIHRNEIYSYFINIFTKETFVSKTNVCR